jgi:hypothetical protein
MVCTHFGRVHDVVQAHSQELEQTTLPPHSFFVAWNGVLCLVFEGFPPGLVDLKQALNNECTSVGIKSEAFGSKWPKVTLGYPKKEHPIATTLPDLIQLKSLCQKFDTTNYPPVGIQTLSVVYYAQRSLEQLHERRDIQLRLSPSNKVFSESSHLPSQEETDRVEKVRSEWKDCSSYLERVKVPLDAPYRDGSPEGHTCVVFLDLPENSPLLMERIRAFRKAMVSVFPAIVTMRSFSVGAGSSSSSDSMSA